MLVVHHPDQALHDPDTVFRTGQFIAQPDRAERYRIFLDTASGRHEIVQAVTSFMSIKCWRRASMLTFDQSVIGSASRIPTIS